MPHNNHTSEASILELEAHPREWYIDTAKDWVDPLGDPVVIDQCLEDGRSMRIIREDLHDTGLKARWADLLMQRVPNTTLVYVQPRVGYAGISLARVAKIYGKKLVLFCPAAKEASEHQKIAASLGAELRFVRIAAMPVLQSYAAKFASRHNLLFIPLGLKAALITAAGVNYALRLAAKYGEPEEMWFATSTGVLARAFMIAYEDRCRYRMVAVARNMQAGEKGPAKIYSHPREFAQPSLTMPPYPSIRTYDAKVWEFVEKYATDQAFVMNVACEQPAPNIEIKNTDKAWGDLSALETPPL
jgi:hypothetical protein